jgi:hypothetical protein
VQKPETTTSNSFAREPFPGFTGKRYWVCDDQQWHLVMKVYDGGMTDVLCSENVQVLQPQPDTRNADPPMCKVCVELHFGNNKR